MKMLVGWVVDAVGSVRCLAWRQCCLWCNMGDAVCGAFCGVSCQVIFCHQRHMRSVNVFRFLFLTMNPHFSYLLLAVCTVCTMQVDVWSTGCVLLELLFGHRRWASILKTRETLVSSYPTLPVVNRLMWCTDTSWYKLEILRVEMSNDDVDHYLKSSQDLLHFIVEHDSKYCDRL